MSSVKCKLHNRNTLISQSYLVNECIFALSFNFVLKKQIVLTLNLKQQYCILFVPYAHDLIWFLLYFCISYNIFSLFCHPWEIIASEVWSSDELLVLKNQ